uniref:Protein kinase domain-containing protein n=1 Tax=Oryza nivara TaxID=4536 RepID=A0A0E0IPX6_ORYNI
MPNAGLDIHLYSANASSLPWPLRHEIVLGVGSALLYLQEGWEQCVVHRDIKPSNIMLDAAFNAKLGDFGLARLIDHGRGSHTTVIAGTMGYMDPECMLTGRANTESDIYSFGSRIIITTRSQEVASLASPDKIIRLEPLSEQEAWSLFCKTTFKEDADRECPNQLKHLATKILERCYGLPLAIISVGNLLALKERTLFAWKNVHDSLVWYGSSDHGIGQVSSILNLSIDDLPHHLKICLMYCNIYPEDFLLKRKILIRKWIAEGLIEEKVQGTMEEVADDYLNQLVQRSLLHVVLHNEFGRAKLCRIHDLIRELIVHRLLTMLNLWLIQIHKLPSTVANLVNLRYLGIRSTLIEELPRELGQLQNLQTLDAKWSMTLKYIKADEKMIKSLGSLKQMRSLELSGVDDSNLLHLPSSISKMSCLLRLGIITRDANVELDMEPFNPTPSKLQKLNLPGRLVRGNLPSWFGSLNNLMQLQLHSSDLKEDSIGLLSYLPRLLHLSLINAYNGRSLTFIDGSFPALKKLSLHGLPNLSHLEFQKGSLVDLRELMLGRCVQLTEIPQGIENLTHLEKMDLFEQPTVLIQQIQNGEVLQEHRHQDSKISGGARNFVKPGQ